MGSDMTSVADLNTYRGMYLDDLIRSNNPLNVSVQCRCMASNSNTNEKTHHGWQRSILGISWKDLQMNRSESKLEKSMDDILSERRVLWLGHVIRMDHQRIPRQALHWEVEVPGFKRGPSRPRTNWRSTVNKDLLRMGITWEGSRGGSSEQIRMCRSVKVKKR